MSSRLSFGSSFLSAPLSALALVLCAGCSSSGTDPAAGFKCPDSVASAANSEFCSATAGELDCARVTPFQPNQVCGVPLRTPKGELERSASVQKYAGTGPADLACYAPGGYPAAPETPQMITLKGVAEIFSHGCESTDLTIEIWTVKRTGGADDAEPGALVGAAVTTPADCKMDALATTDEECGTRYECNFSYPNVPTETELLIKTYGPFWAPLYEYNLFVRNSAVQNLMWEKNVRALAVDDYGVIAQVAIGSPITAGNGAIAGEIHDCGDVRIKNAIVDVNVPRKVTTYFTDNEDHPLPDPAAQGTSTLGLYSAMDIAPGPATIGAIGMVNGQIVTAGFFRARVYPDAVTSVTFRGLSPFLVPGP